MRSAYVANGISDRTLRALNYTPQVDAFRRRVMAGGGTLLSDLVVEFGRAYRKAFIRVDAQPGHGEAFLSQGDTFAAEPDGRTISLDRLADPTVYRIQRGEVLIAGAGTLAPTELYGRCIIADARLTGKLMCEDTFSLTFAEPKSDAALFCYAFLASNVGVRILRSMSYGTKILRIRRDLLHTLPIPLPLPETQRRVADLVRTTVTGRERYLEEVEAARACIEALPVMQEALAVSRERRARCVAWEGELPTMTAWTYASAGHALALLERAWPGRLGDLVGKEDVFRGARNLRTRCDPPFGVDFMSQRDAFLIRPIPQRITMAPEAIEASRCEPGWLLAGGQGTLGEGEIFGRVALVGPDTAGACFTEHLLRIRVRADAAYTTFAYLSTLVGLRLIRSCAVGTKLLSVRPDLLRRLPVPELPSEARRRVEHHVSCALEARAAATAAEQEAIRIVEEEVLPEWLA